MPSNRDVAIVRQPLLDGHNLVGNADHTNNRLRSERARDDEQQKSQQDRGG